jgi:regulator of sirC expression with transglutaminase-like and TPR domain
MTLLRVHDNQQDLTNDFVRLAAKQIRDTTDSKQIQQVFMQGQEMGFCNDEIKILLEDILNK